VTFLAITIAFVIDAHLGGATIVGRVLAGLEATSQATSAKLALAVLTTLAEIAATLQLMKLEKYGLVVAERALVIELAIAVHAKKVPTWSRSWGLVLVRLALISEFG